MLPLPFLFIILYFFCFVNTFLNFFIKKFMVRQPAYQKKRAALFERLDRLDKLHDDIVVSVDYTFYATLRVTVLIR